MLEASPIPALSLETLEDAGDDPMRSTPMYDRLKGVHSVAMGNAHRNGSEGAKPERLAQVVAWSKSPTCLSPFTSFLSTSFSLRKTVDRSFGPNSNPSYTYLAGSLEGMGCKRITVEGVEDHVHILCNMTKSKADKDVLMELKKESSKRAKEWEPAFYWQDGYACLGVSGSHRDKVKQYVLNQEEHHRKIGFKEELKRILDANQVDYDERYLWD